MGSENLGVQQQVTDEALNAMSIYQRLMNGGMEEAVNTPQTLHEPDDDSDAMPSDDEIRAMLSMANDARSTKSKVKGTSKTGKSTRSGGRTAEKTIKPISEYKVPELEQYKDVKKDVKINVTQTVHDIKYKEQFWNIPSRQIEYNLEMITNPKLAKDAAKQFNGDSEEALNKAVSGEERYLIIRTNVESVPYRSRELGYIMLRVENGKIKVKHKLFKEKLKDQNINVDNVIKALQKVMPSLLGYEQGNSSKEG